MSEEPPSKRLLGLDPMVKPASEPERMGDYWGRVGTKTSENPPSNAVGKQEPMIPGFEEPAPKHEPEMRARMIRDVVTDLPNAEDFEFEAVYVYWNKKTGERFVETPGTGGGTLYSPVGDVVK